jgi:hypothetical protein
MSDQAVPHKFLVERANVFKTTIGAGAAVLGAAISPGGSHVWKFTLSLSTASVATLRKTKNAVNHDLLLNGGSAITGEFAFEIGVTPDIAYNLLITTGGDVSLLVQENQQPT